nr:uncharacterized protein LOC113821505 [Penaeus vannamei]
MGATTTAEDLWDLPLLGMPTVFLATTKVSFCGYNISPEGIAADPEKVAAIRDYPTPSNITDLRSFMGLVNQLADFSPEIAATAQPLRPLMSPKRSFTWTPDHDQAFGKVKAALLSPPVLAPFNPKLPVTLQTDASRLYGLGYALFQEHGHGQLRLVQCGSRFLTDAESRYATIELEMLAASWAMGKCRLYLAGLQHFTLHTDHRPLIPILNHYTLDAIENPRLQRLRVKMAPYVFTAVWRAGKTLCVPDALSRAPTARPQLLSSTTTGLYRSFAPSHQRTKITAASWSTHLHDSHRGVEATHRRARQTVYWPGIDSDIKSTVEACDSCQRLQPSQQQEPYLCDDQPSRPFESVSADFFQVAGKSFLVIADRLSGWPVVTPCGQDTTATKVMRMFCGTSRSRCTCPLRTDGGPHSPEEFRRFTERWGVHHLVASPHYPQSNGHAEAAVKSVKYLILKTAPDGNIDCEAFDRGLLELRNTPTPAGRSPAQILYGHPLRTCVPAHPQSFSAEWQTKSDDWDRAPLPKRPSDQPL